MRYVLVDDVEMEISDEVAEELLDSGALVESGEDGHEEPFLCLNIDHLFTRDEVAKLLIPE